MRHLKEGQYQGKIITAMVPGAKKPTEWGML